MQLFTLFNVCKKHNTIIMKHYKKWLLLFAAVLFSTFIVAQNRTADQLVEEFLGSSRYESNLVNNPGLIEYLKVKSTQGYSIDTVSQEKFNSFEALPLILYNKNEISGSQFTKDIQSPDFNFLKYSFPTVDGGGYRLSSENNTVIIIYSNDNINFKTRNK